MKNEYSILVGKQLKALRIYKRMSLRDVEERCGLSFSAIGKYENGRSIDLDRLKLLCEDGLGISMIDFLTDVQKIANEK